MANPYGADVLASLNRILQYRQESEKNKISESLSMLQMAQDQRNLDRSYNLEREKMGIGDTQYAQDVRKRRNIELQVKQLELDQANIAKEFVRKDLEASQQNKQLQIKQAAQDLRTSQRKDFESRMDELQILADKNKEDLSNEAMSFFGLSNVSRILATGDDDTRVSEAQSAFKELDFYKNLPKNLQSSVMDEFIAELNTSIAYKTTPIGITDIFINYANSLWNTDKRNPNRITMDKLNEDQKRAYRIFNFGFEGKDLEFKKIKAFEFGQQFINMESLQKNIDSELSQAASNEDFRIDSFVGQSITPSDKELLTSIIQGEEDPDNLPPSFLAEQGSKQIVKQIKNLKQAQLNLKNNYEKKYEQVKNKSNPSEDELELIDDYEDAKERLITELSIAKRVQRQIQLNR